MFSEYKGKQFLCIVSTLFVLDLNSALGDLLVFSTVVLVVALVGLLLEEKVMVRLILLLEIILAAIIGWLVAFYGYLGSLSAIVSILILVIAAVESILLFGFIILLHRLNQASDLSKLDFLQF